MESLRLSAEQLVRRVAESERLDVDIVYRDVFGHCMNAPEAVARLKTALDAEEIEYSGQGLPLRGSEDFGLFNQRSRSAMFFLGAGMDPMPACMIQIMIFRTN
jgi:metal-dependent amidase/aminoacylase/carboxypeptidase family protein